PGGAGGLPLRTPGGGRTGSGLHLRIPGAGDNTREGTAPNSKPRPRGGTVRSLLRRTTGWTNGPASPLFARKGKGQRSLTAPVRPADASARPEFPAPAAVGRTSPLGIVRTEPTTSLRALVRVAREVGLPHLFDVVEFADFGPEDVDDHVATIDQHPV